MDRELYQDNVTRALSVILTCHTTEHRKGIPFDSAAISFQKLMTLLDVASYADVAQALKTKDDEGYDISDFVYDISTYSHGWALLSAFNTISL